MRFQIAVYMKILINIIYNYKYMLLLCATMIDPYIASSPRLSRSDLVLWVSESDQPQLLCNPHRVGSCFFQLRELQRREAGGIRC